MDQTQTQAAGVPTGAGSGEATPQPGAGMASVPQVADGAQGNGAPSGGASQGQTEQKPSRQVTPEDFDKWRSNMDRQQAAIRQQAQAAEQRAAQSQQQADQMAEQLRQIRMQNADPEQKAALLEAELQNVRAQQKALSDRQKAEQFYTQQGFELLEQAGVEWNDPEIQPYLGGGLSAQGVATLAKGLLAVQKARLAKAEAAREQARNEGKLEALRAHGIGGGTTATGGSSDERSAKQRQMDEFEKSMRGRGERGYAEAMKMRNELGI